MAFYGLGGRISTETWWGEQTVLPATPALGRAGLPVGGGPKSTGGPGWPARRPDSPYLGAAIVLPVAAVLGHSRAMDVGGVWAGCPCTAQCLSDLAPALYH